jgi:hypothetical protein
MVAVARAWTIPTLGPFIDTRALPPHLPLTLQTCQTQYYGMVKRIRRTAHSNLETRGIHMLSKACILEIDFADPHGTEKLALLYSLDWRGRICDQEQNFMEINADIPLNATQETI